VFKTLVSFISSMQKHDAAMAIHHFQLSRPELLPFQERRTLKSRESGKLQQTLLRATTEMFACFQDLEIDRLGPMTPLQWPPAGLKLQKTVPA
jgi:hypothetical protein